VQRLKEKGKSGFAFSAAVVLFMRRWAGAHHHPAIAAGRLELGNDEL
jgi:hypothetical protein